MIQDPHVPGTPWTHTSLWQAAKVLLPPGVQGQGCRDSGTAHKVVFRNHADHLVSESPCIPRQNLRMQMSYGSAIHIIPRWRLLPRMLVKPRDGGESPLHVLEGKGKCRPHLPISLIGNGGVSGAWPI